MYESSTDTLTTLEEIYESLYYGLGIAELGIAGIVLMAGIIGAIVSAIVSFATSVIIWIAEAYPVYKLAKKTGYKHAYLAWIPVFGNHFRLYVLAAMPERKPFSVFNDKIKMESRSLSFWAYLGIFYFGNTLITAVVGVLSTILPGIGTISSVLYLLPWVAMGIMEYVYLKDVLDLFKPDQKSNSTTAIVITLLDNFATFGLARAVYLYTLLKYEPLPQRFYARRY